MELFHPCLPEDYFSYLAFLNLGAVEAHSSCKYTISDLMTNPNSLGNLIL